MDSVVQYVLDKSNLEVTLIKITDATEEYVATGEVAMMLRQG